MTARGDLPAWQIIRTDLLRMIQTGVWKPGDHIPNEVELADRYGVTRSTVSRALRDLAEAGFLVRKRKGGTHVAPNPTRKAPLDVPIIRDAIRKAGYVPDYRLIDARLETPPGDVAAKLSVKPRRSLFHVRALHLADDQPYIFEDRWLDPDSAEGLLKADLEAVPIDEWLLRYAPLSSASIAILAVSAEGDAALRLAVPDGSPLLTIERVSYRMKMTLGWVRLYHHPGYRIETSI